MNGKRIKMSERYDSAFYIKTLEAANRVWQSVEQRCEIFLSDFQFARHRIAFLTSYLFSYTLGILF